VDAETEVVLGEATRLFEFDADVARARLLGNSANLIYEFERAGASLILRVSQQDGQSVAGYESEIKWVNYLADNDVGVCRAIPSLSDTYVEVIEIGRECYLVSAFEKAKGQHPDVKSKEEWNAGLFREWGRTMGRMHALAKKTVMEGWRLSRSEWNQNRYFTAEYPLEEDLVDEWDSVTRQMESLPKDYDSYGLIHYDFHQANFFVDGGRITVFDFDDCLYHWYACDMAISLYHALCSVPHSETDERKEFAYGYLEPFLRGYLSETDLDVAWIEKLPLFLDYRRLCSYRFLSKLWSGEGMVDWQMDWLQYLRNGIVDGIPYIDVDLHSIQDRLVTEYS
jgi:Ser/Thr protein kinase RdoA (MazF antagonist)